MITGRVYNQNQIPPWDLPANATQSGFLSRSSEQSGYGNANAQRFEGKKSAEQVWLQAERNLNIQVEHDERHHVMHDRKKDIDHNEIVQVSKHVNFNGDPVYLLSDSVVAKVTGNEPGSGGGLKSGVNRGKVRATSSSKSVRVEKKFVVRHGDECDMNLAS